MKTKTQSGTAKCGPKDKVWDKFCRQKAITIQKVSSIFTIKKKFKFALLLLMSKLMLSILCFNNF